VDITEGDPRRALVGLIGAAALSIALTGCAVAPGGTGTPSPAAVSSSPDSATGAAGDSPPQYSLNKRHHDRTELTAEAEAQLQGARTRVLQELSALPAPVAEDAVVTALSDAGAVDTWSTTDLADGTVHFETAAEESGCLIGTVTRAGSAAIEVGGWVLDGGCHALDGH